MLANDSEIFFATAAGIVYVFSALIIYGSPAGAGAPDLKCTFGITTNPFGTASYTGINVSDTGIATTTQGCSVTAGVTFGTAATNRTVYVQGVTLGDGNPLRLLWAQNTSNAAATIVRAESYVTYLAVG